MTVLYAAFAVVALWLLGELLLQRRAPLQWRALALAGFLGLVAGVAAGSLPLIGAGVLGFGAGQALAARALKRPGGPYWSLVAPERVPVVGKLFGAEAAVAPVRPQPVVVGEVSPVEAVDPATAVFQPEQYPVGEDSVYYGEQPDASAGYYSYSDGDYQQQYTQQYAEQYAQQYAAYAPEQGQSAQQVQYDAYGQPLAYVPYQPTGEQHEQYAQQQYDAQPYAEGQQYAGYEQAAYQSYADSYQGYSGHEAYQQQPAGYGYEQQPGYAYPQPEHPQA